MKLSRLVLVAIFTVALFGAVSAHAEGSMEGQVTNGITYPPGPVFCVNHYCQDIVSIKLPGGQMGSNFCAYVGYTSYCDCKYDFDSGNYVATGYCVYF